MGAALGLLSACPLAASCGSAHLHHCPNCLANNLLPLLFTCYRTTLGEGGMSQEEKAKMVLDDLADRLPEQYDMEDIRGRVDEVTPYVMVAIQVSATAPISWTDALQATLMHT